MWKAETGRIMVSGQPRQKKKKKFVRSQLEGKKARCDGVHMSSQP
jgi:hypothetical protein